MPTDANPKALSDSGKKGRNEKRKGKEGMMKGGKGERAKGRRSEGERVMQGVMLR